jgi:flagellar basal-body rod protein FlgB
MTTILSDVTNDMVRQALDAASLRHLVHAHNIANANTADFVPLKVSFSRQLDAAMADAGRGGGKTIRSIWDGAVVEPDHEAVQAGASGVGLDQEIARLSQNVVQYQALLRALSGKMAIVSLAISEGRK